MDSISNSTQQSDESRELSELLKKHYGRIVIYTGAGISTSASIPDYRGTFGLYRNEDARGKKSRKMRPTKLRLPQASVAKPTFTHMAIEELVKHGYVSHTVLHDI